MDKFSGHPNRGISKKELEKYAFYVVGKVYHLLKPGGEIFITASRFALERDRWIEVTFHTGRERKNFILFSHIFKTKKKYQFEGESLGVESFDFQKYLNPPYVEKEVIDSLLKGRSVEEMDLEEIHDLPYLNFSLDDPLAYDQEKGWPKLLSVYFNRIFLKSLLPDSIREDWQIRFSTGIYLPDYMLIYLGQKRPLETTLEEIKKDVIESRLSGCPLPLLAGYRDSYDYLIGTLEVLRRIRGDGYPGLQQPFMDRLKGPFENKKRRYVALNDVLRLMSKVGRLKRIRLYFNPDEIEGVRTRVLDNLEALSLFGFTHGELKEIFLIVVGHTAMGRILCGKTSEKALKPVSDLARTYDPQEAINLLRYCRLMSMAETVASKKTDLNQEELAEIFDLHERMVRVVTNREMDWERLLDERISNSGGVKGEFMRQVLKMMNHYPFLANWSELTGKGEMEKEALADHDEEKLLRVENVIRLVRIIDQFEKAYLNGDPLKASVFYRKFLNTEFHGTVRVFGSLDSELVFLLLWITVNVARGNVINLNPVLSDIEPSEIDSHVQKLQEGASGINTKYLDLSTLEQFSEQLYEDQSSFILGTGFQLRVNHQSQGIDIHYVDMDENLEELEMLTRKFSGNRVSEIPAVELEELERLFSHVEGFYQSHLKLIAHDDSELKVPERQREWFRRAQGLMESLRSAFIGVIFQAEGTHTELVLLYRHSPSLLRFVLPEFMALEGVNIPAQGDLKGPPIEHILTGTKKIQALLRRDRPNFQDVQLLHKLAQREFGPMAAGIVGLSEFQVEVLEDLVQHLRDNQPLFHALIKSFIFRYLGLVPSLRKKYQDLINPADYAQAGALFLEKEKMSFRYQSDQAEHDYLVLLIKYHNLLRNMIRGEFSFYALADVLNFKNKDLFDAIFVSSFIMFYATGEDLIMEDLATRLLQLRALGHQIIAGETNPEDYLRELYVHKGHLFKALEAYHRVGLPEDKTPGGYLESYAWKESEKAAYIDAGKMIYAMERLFRLRGIRYVEFPDLANLVVKVPLRFIYRKRKHYGIGQATLEKELFEALRVYNGFFILPEMARHFILQRLVTDEVRIFGFERVSAFLNYENFIKLLLIALLGSQKFKKGGGPICLNFLGMAESIEKLYEAVNEALSNMPVDKVWGDRNQVTHFFRAKTGIHFKKDQALRVLSLDFIDPIRISQKISHMKTITDEGQLKNYFHHTLMSLREKPFSTDEYEVELEKAFEKRFKEIR